MKFVLVIVTACSAAVLRTSEASRGGRYTEEPRTVVEDTVSEKTAKRAEAAATLHAERESPSSQFYPIASLPDSEVLPSWRIYSVMLQSKSRFRVLKVCLPDDDSQTTIVLEQDELCAEAVESVQSDRAEDAGSDIERAADTAAELAALLQRLAQGLRPKPRPLIWAD